MKKESVLKCCKMLELGRIVLSGDVFFCSKIVFVDNLFTPWALTENIIPAIPRLEYIFIFISSACSLQQCLINYFLKKDKGLTPPPQKVFYRYTETLLYSSIESCSYICFYTSFDMFYLILVMSRPDINFLVSGGHFVYCQDFQGQNINLQHLPHPSSHLFDTHLHIKPFMFIRVFIACSVSS